MISFKPLPEQMMTKSIVGYMHHGDSMRFGLHIHSKAAHTGSRFFKDSELKNNGTLIQIPLIVYVMHMMTVWYGNAFLISWPLWGPQVVSSHKGPVIQSFETSSMLAWASCWTNSQVIWYAIAPMWRHCNKLVIYHCFDCIQKPSLVSSNCMSGAEVGGGANGLENWKKRGEGVINTF